NIDYELQVPGRYLVQRYSAENYFFSTFENLPFGMFFISGTMYHIHYVRHDLGNEFVLFTSVIYGMVHILPLLTSILQYPWNHRKESSICSRKAQVSLVTTLKLFLAKTSSAALKLYTTFFLMFSFNDEVVTFTSFKNTRQRNAIQVVSVIREMIKDCNVLLTT
ncbi:hypothetical protein L9F63_002616, partial [Diploptera punctata]